MSFARIVRHAVPRVALLASAALVLPTAAQARLVAPSDCQPDQSLLAQPFSSLGDFTAYEPVGGPYALSDGSSVLTSAACVNITHPTVRFFVAGDPGATVSVSAVFTPGAATVSIPLGSVPADAGVSAPMPIDVVNMPGLHGQNALVPLRFTVSGGNAEIGTVWVDPWGGT